MPGSGDQVPFDVHTELLILLGVNPELHWKARVAPFPLPLTDPITPLAGGRGSLHWTVETSTDLAK